MPNHFQQTHYDPEQESIPPRKFPIAMVLAVPIALLFAVGIGFAAKLGHDLASAELEKQRDPAAANEVLSTAFLFDPGDEPIVFAAEQKSLRDHLQSPPGSIGSGTFVESKPIRLRLIEQDQDLVRVLIVDGKLQGQRFWTKGDRLQARDSETGGD